MWMQLRNTQQNLIHVPKVKILVHVIRSISPSSLSAMIISATFAKIWTERRGHDNIIWNEIQDKRDCFCYQFHVTWSGITTINNFLSLSASMCLINVQPVPINTIVMKSTAPFSLYKMNKCIIIIMKTWNGLKSNEITYKCVM